MWPWGVKAERWGARRIVGASGVRRPSFRCTRGILHEFRPSWRFLTNDHLPTDRPVIRRLLLPLVLLLGAPACRAAPLVVDGISFAEEPGAVYLPLEEAAGHLRWPVRHDRKGGFIHLNGHALRAPGLRHLPDGTPLMKLADLGPIGAAVTRDPDARLVNVGDNERYFTVRIPPKQVTINLAEQELRAWQGARLVLRSRISSGRDGTTPSGQFRAGPYKEAVHYSTRYRQARMPWSVQVTGNIFIHGFKAVPRTPASNGCIRLPLDEGNPARFFFEWVDTGTPIEIRNR